MTNITAMSCIVFLVVCLSTIEEISTVEQVAERIIISLVGVCIATTIDFILPNKHKH